jgi:hypothetical protein
LTLVLDEVNAVIFYTEIIRKAPNVEEIVLTIAFSRDVDQEHNIDIDDPLDNLNLSICAHLWILQVTFVLDSTFHFQRHPNPA